MPLDLLPHTAFPLPASPITPSFQSHMDLGNSMSSSKVTTRYPEEMDLGTFIVERWKQLGVGHVFGVPGDFNLGFLDYIEDDPQIQWVGTASELGAGYAADGYARVKKSLSVLVTTYGVGETSTLNPISGMQSERIPCLHLVGLPSTEAMGGRGKLLHHTLGDGNMRVFERMSREVSGERGVGMIGLGTEGEEDMEGWTETVDRVMRVAIRERRPVYLGLPQDLVSRRVSSQPLYTSLLECMTIRNVVADDEKADELARRIVTKLRSVRRPVVIGDFYAQRFGYGEQMRGMCKALGVRYFGTNLAKSMLDEQDRLYGGVYAGKMTDQPAKHEVETADMCLIVGRMDSDLNTGMFSGKLPLDTVSINLEDTIIDGLIHAGIGMHTLLGRITEVARTTEPNPWDEKVMFEPRSAMEEVGMQVQDDKLNHERFWGEDGKDVIFSDVGTSSMGLVNVKIPARASTHFQHLWASIGWSGGAVLGGALAARERPDNAGNPPRTIVFIGDGALQMTLQEIGSIIRNRLPVYFFINNNNGYEIERQIHGPNAKYNDIQTIDHHLLIRALAGPLYDELCVTHKVKTQAELDGLLTDPEFLKPGKFRMIEFHLPQGDAPRALKLLQGGFNVPDRVKVVKVPSRPMTPVSVRIPSRPSTPVSALRRERPIGPFTPEPKGMAF